MKIAAFALTALLVTAGCGGSDDSEAEPKTSPEPAVGDTAPASEVDAIESAVAAYSEAFLSGDGAGAYALLSLRCQDRTPLSEFAAVVEQAADMYGPQAIEGLDVVVNGGQAQATYTYAEDVLNQDKEPWVNEDGWKNDDC